MDHSTMHELVSGERVYKLSTLADIVESAYRAGVRAREQHLFPAFNNYVAVLPKLLRLAYANGLEPKDEHFEVMGARVCPMQLIVYATSQKLADEHGRRHRYAMSWDLHVVDRSDKDRAELLALAYASGDIAMDFPRHVDPLGVYLGWRAMAAAYAAGTPVDRAFEIDGDMLRASAFCPRRQRASVAPVLLAWIAAKYATRLEFLPVQWITATSKRNQVLFELYARNCVPRRRHLRQYGIKSQGVVKRARVRYARANLMQRKCLGKFLPPDLALAIYDKIRASDLG